MLSCRRSCCVLRLRCYGIVSALLPSLRMNGRVYVSAIVTHRLLTTLLANPPRITTTAPTPTRNVTFTVHFLSRIFFFFAFTVFFFSTKLYYVDASYRDDKKYRRSLFNLCSLTLLYGTIYTDAFVLH